jgi:hypothetical protein
LSQYGSAYKAAAPSGWYPLTPPSVQFSQNDPSTGQPFTVTTSPVTAVGQIQYKAGAVCSNPANVAGPTGSHHLALYALLEGNTTPTCQQVQ